SYSPKGSDEIVGFRPFCCTQQLQDARPWIGFVFVVEVEEGEPEPQLSETRDTKWVPVDEVRYLFDTAPDKFFGLELPAWDYYLRTN
ncbi:hypothetical protein KC968_04385, partial [Candidatus Saccharibacteria bacterium]|nr:hypothetical protein [Candidatus Saccharibacteria bacterium]